MAAPEHHHHTRKHLRVAVITASDTRTLETDESGAVIASLAASAGHQVVHREVVPDSPDAIAASVKSRVAELDAIIVNGGTGIAPRDLTIEALRPLLDKELEGFGELFRMLSYQEIGSAAFLSRALAGTVAGKIVVALPGSPAACRLAMEKLLLPELSHMAHLLGL
jgi:molybdopterin adenylyltransferase